MFNAAKILPRREVHMSLRLELFDTTCSVTLQMDYSIGICFGSVSNTTDNKNTFNLI